MHATSGEIVRLWHRVLAAAQHSDVPDLTARQFALFLQVYLIDPPHTVRGLAATLNMSKPAVSRALDRLSALGLLRREPDSGDRRSILVKRTVSGAMFLRDFSALATSQVEGVGREGWGAA